MSAVQYRAGDRVWRWWASGAMGSDPQPLTVVVHSGTSVRVRTDQGSTFRLPVQMIEGRWDDVEGPIGAAVS